MGPGRHTKLHQGHQARPCPLHRGAGHPLQQLFLSGRNCQDSVARVGEGERAEEEWRRPPAVHPDAWVAGGDRKVGGTWG